MKKKFFTDAGPATSSNGTHRVGKAEQLRRNLRMANRTVCCTSYALVVVCPVATSNSTLAKGDAATPHAADDRQSAETHTARGFPATRTFSVHLGACFSIKTTQDNQQRAEFVSLSVAIISEQAATCDGSHPRATFRANTLRNNHSSTVYDTR